MKAGARQAAETHTNQKTYYRFRCVMTTTQHKRRQKLLAAARKLLEGLTVSWSYISAGDGWDATKVKGTLSYKSMKTIPYPVRLAWKQVGEDYIYREVHRWRVEVQHFFEGIYCPAYSLFIYDGKLEGFSGRVREEAENNLLAHRLSDPDLKYTHSVVKVSLVAANYVEPEEENEDENECAN